MATKLTPTQEAALDALRAVKVTGNSEGWIWSPSFKDGKVISRPTLYALRTQGLIETKSSGLHSYQDGGAYSKTRWTSDIAARPVNQ